MNILANSVKKLGMLAVLLVMSTSVLWATGEENYFDYLPKYRKFKSHYQIDKIEYRDKRTIIYFRFVSQNDGNVSFFSGAHPNSWYLRTPPRMRGIEVQFKLLEIRDIRINNEVKLETLTHVPEVDYETIRGDVVTCQMHFVRIPHYIRMLDLIQGKDGDMDQNRLNCFDILVKTHGSPLLGQKESANKMTERFEQAFPYIKPKVKESVLTASQRNANMEKEAAAKENEKKPYKEVVAKEENDVGPIDYRPDAMNSLKDLKCQTRVVLPAVNFKEDEIKFNGRLRAIQDIRTLFQYLNYYPKSKIRLHGHTDVHGNDIKNLQLSRERAIAVKYELVKMGIDRDRIEVLFYGGKYPLKGLESGGDENRRVEAEPICEEN